MNNLYEYLTGAKNMAKEKGSMLWQALTNKNNGTSTGGASSLKPEIEPIQLIRPKWQLRPAS